MEREQKSYLNPPALTKAQLEEIYGPDPEADRLERIAALAGAKSIRRLARKYRSVSDL